MTDFCAHFVYLYPSQLKKAFRAKFGDYSARQIAEYAARAKEQNRAHFHAGRTKLAEESHARIEAIARDPKSSVQMRLKAEELLVNLHGLAEAQRHDVTHRSEDTKERIRKVFGIVHAPIVAQDIPIRNGNGETNGHTNGNGRPAEANGASGVDQDAVAAME